MKLVRLALVGIKGKSRPVDGLVLRSEGLEIGPLKNTVQDGMYFLPATVKLGEIPEITEDNLIIIPEAPRKAAEEGLENFSNLLAVSIHGQRTLSSATPSVALIPESSEDNRFLQKANGFLQPSVNRGIISGLFELPHESYQYLYDRLDGVAILAEALCHGHETGRFHELIRLFERAFSLAGRHLTGPLAAFLSNTSQGFSQSEVTRWLEIRHGVTHADRRSDILFETDVAWFSGRVMQAAYDVLLNKSEWRSPSIARRDAWAPTHGTTSETAVDLFATTSAGAMFNCRVFDEFRRFPSNLNGILKNVPSGWWSKPFRLSNVALLSGKMQVNPPQAPLEGY